jgi:nitrite reductase (NADH) small subunit/3-phenylpropionate/trans-cinnamate dioxygenase ferredoxin subunit
VAFEHVARLADLPPGRGLCVRIRGREIGLYRVGERVYAMENACPHAGYPLHEGELDGCSIVCPGHGWTFDLATGLAPGEVDEPPLARFAVRVLAGEVWVDPDAPPP